MTDETAINPEVLIDLIERRPCLWDKYSEYHRDLVVRSTAWSDICAILKPEYESWEKKEKNSYAKSVMRKWANLRTAWKRTLVEGKKPYAYHEQLKFLMKTPDFGGNEKHITKLEDESDDTSESDFSTSTRSTKKKKTDHKVLENPHVSFIKGLLPNLKKLDEDETLDFQMGVIKLLQDIRKKETVENESSVQISMPSSSFEILNK